MGISTVIFAQRRESTYLVNILIWSTGTESVKTELLVGIPLPSHGGHNLNGQRWNAIWKNAESVLLCLRIEDLEARDGNNTSSQVVGVLKVLNGVNADTNLGTGGNQSDISLLGIVNNVTTLDSVANG